MLPVVDLDLHLAAKTYLRVNAATGSDNPRRGRNRAYQTIQAAVNDAEAGSVILIAPGQYDETVTIPRTTSAIMLVGMGGRGAAYIEPSTEDADGLICHADDVTLLNLGVAAEDTTAGNIALEVSGSRFRAIGCKFEGGATLAKIGPGTVAQEAAGTHGHGGDFLFDGCEFAWGTDGIVLTCTDYGAATQGFIQNGRFHNITGNHITELVGSGGSAAVTYQNIHIDGNVFDLADDGTAPTTFVDLNGNNANTGVFCRNVVPAASNGGKVLLSTKMLSVGNFFTGGISTGQPS